MKYQKHLLFWGLFLAATLSYAQPKKGDLTLGGGVSLTADPFEEDSRSFGLSISPIVGIFLTDHLLVGTQLGGNFYSFSTENYSSFSYGMQVAPSVAYYFGDGPWQPFLSGGVGVSASSRRTQENGILQNPDSRTRINFNARAGAIYWLANHVGITTFVNYSSGRTLNQPDASFNQGLNAGVGVQFIWSR
ncbi:MAG TPA: hypothetical protein DCP28_15710 [Cytophagales bacterium]|nr:hypothetical protein [Cytophagales bacterium]